MKVLIVPDKFKGSLDASRVCAAVRTGLLKADRALEISEQPLADGGEGTCELLTNYTGGKLVDVIAQDPLKRKIRTFIGLSNDGKTAFIEMAKASGLQLLKEVERNPWITTTVGTGEMIRAALDAGARKIVMGIGGSATNDGGMGMATALGVEFYDDIGVRLEGSGSELERLATLSIMNVHPKLARARFIVFCDVDNPLHGPHGAASVFSPQKGARPDMVAALDRGLQHYGTRLSTLTKRQIDFPGAGAGGGLPAALKAFARVEIRAGMEFIINYIGLEQAITDADYVITGEGKVDPQTLSGKVVKGVADICIKQKKPLMIIAGKSELRSEDKDRLGAETIITLADDTTSEEVAMEKAFELIVGRVQAYWTSRAKTRKA